MERIHRPAAVQPRRPHQYVFHVSVVVPLTKPMPTDLASAYIISPVARPDLALQHL